MRRRPGVVRGVLLAAAILASAAQAQTTGGGLVGTAPGFAAATQSVTSTATVTAIDMPTRRVTLRRADGSTFDVIAGEEVRNLPQLRVGDRVSLSYLEALTLELRKGGTGSPPSVTEAAKAARAELGARPGGTVARETTIVADVVAVDAVNRMASLRGPRGNVVVLPVRDPEQFKLIAVGDQVEATYVEAVALSVTPVAAVAMAPPRPEYRLFLFAWASGVDGDITTRNPLNPSQHVRVSFDWDFDNLLDDLDAAFMIYGDARFGPWSVFGDYTYTKVSPSSNLDRSVVFDRADTDLKTQIGQVNVGYAIWEDRANRGNRFELYGGARYYSTRNKVFLRSGPNELESDANQSWWDGVVGVRAVWDLAPRWVAVGQLDGGWGGSDHSVQFWGYVGYQFDWGSVGGGWRYLNFKRDHGGVTNDLTYNGPLLGVTARF